MIGLALTALALQQAAPSAPPAQSVAPLFAEDEVLDVTIQANFGRLIRNAKRNPDPYQATVSVNGQPHAATVEARGVSRRTGGLCSFPPLRVRFPAKPDATSIFEGQKSLKVVTHCKDNGAFEQNMLREYSAYRLYNLVTDESLKVRLARIRYEDDDGDERATRMGFFIEDIDAAADRLGGTEINLPQIGTRWIDARKAARYVLFQYMIGNLDWSMFRGPEGENCCHNSKIIGPDRAARSGLTPVPYDFDMSGWVDAPYAVVPSGVRVRNVRQRFYRGLCRFGPDTLEIAAEWRPRQGEFRRAFLDVPGMSADTSEELDAFLSGFFSDIADNSRIQDRLLDDCR